MVFLFILAILVIAFVTTRIKIKIDNFEFNSQKNINCNNNSNINSNYKIETVFYIFNFLPIFKTNITDEKVKKMSESQNVKNMLNKQKTRLFEDENKIDLKDLRKLKNLKIDSQKFDLRLLIGTEDAALTAFIIPVISSTVAIVLRKKFEKFNENHYFEISPIFIDKNLVNIKFSGIFQVKMIHIINTICVINKKRKGDINERTSNRRSYDYSYEQH